MIEKKYTFKEYNFAVITEDSEFYIVKGIKILNTNSIFKVGDSVKVFLADEKKYIIGLIDSFDTIGVLYDYLNKKKDKEILIHLKTHEIYINPKCGDKIIHCRVLLTEKL